MPINGASKIIQISENLVMDSNKVVELHSEALIQLYLYATIIGTNSLVINPGIIGMAMRL